MASEPTSAEPTGESAAELAAEPAKAPAQDASSETAPAPRRRATRKRATAKAGAPAEAPAAEVPAAEALEAQPAADDAAGAGEKTTPAKGTRRSRKKAEPVVDEAAVADEAAAADETAAADESAADESTTEESSDAVVATMDADESDESDEAEDTDGSSESAATVPSFGLLFQAPEPAAPRRSRRATSDAGAPTRKDPAPAESPADAASSAEDAQSDSADQTDQDSGDGSDSGGSRRSRRRGGRGRRTRGGDSDSGQSDSDNGDTSDSGDTNAGSKSGSGRSSTSKGGSAQDADADGKGADHDSQGTDTGGDASEDSGNGEGGSRRRRRRRRGADSDSDESRGAKARDEVTGLKGSTRLEAKKQRRREGREAGRRRQIITEAEFLARRESVERTMVVRERNSDAKGLQTQIGVLEDGVLVEHYVSRETGASMIGNVYLGRVQNVLPSMEAAFVDIGKGRNAVLYAGEVNWDAAGLEGNMPKRIENALTSGDTVLVQVTKDPIGHKGARLTSQVSLPGRFLVYVPEASMTGISRKLPDTERSRLKAILKKIVPDDAGVIVRTAAEGASEEELTADIERLTKAWDKIRTKADKAGKKKGSGAPLLLHGEPDLTVKVIRDVFNEDFTSLVVAGNSAFNEVSDYLEDVAPELAKRLTKWTSETDLFTTHRVDEQLAKALDRKVWLPSGGSLVIDRTEAMTVVDVNTGKFVGSGGNLEETVTKNNIEAAEEIVRQLRLRDIGGIIVIDFIDMVLESNRDLVVRRLLECLGRDRTKHQVAEVTSLGLVQMTRKRVGTGLLEVFSESCAHCSGRGIIVHSDPIDQAPAEDSGANRGRGRGRGGNGHSGNGQGANGHTGNGNGSNNSNQGNGKGRGNQGNNGNGNNGSDHGNGPSAAQIAAAAHAAALKAAAAASNGEDAESAAAAAVAEVSAEVSAEVDVTTAEPTTDSGEATAEEATHTTEQASGATADEPASEISQSREKRESAPEPAAALAPASEPVAKPRRKRGRVVAQAGPPGQSEVRVVTSEG